MLQFDYKPSTIHLMDFKLSSTDIPETDALKRRPHVIKTGVACRTHWSSWTMIRVDPWCVCALSMMDIRQIEKKDVTEPGTQGPKHVKCAHAQRHVGGTPSADDHCQTLACISLSQVHSFFLNGVCVLLQFDQCVHDKGGTKRCGPPIWSCTLVDLSVLSPPGGNLFSMFLYICIRF